MLVYVKKDGLFCEIVEWNEVLRSYLVVGGVIIMTRAHKNRWLE